MKPFSFVRYLSRLSRPRTIRNERPKRHPRTLPGPELVEERVLPATPPFIVYAATPPPGSPQPADGSTLPFGQGHPTIQVTYSESMNVAGGVGAADKTNYLLFDDQNDPISVDAVTDLN